MKRSFIPFGIIMIMISTRDFFLYVVILVFLILGVVFTANQQSRSSVVVADTSDPSFSTQDISGIATEVDMIDREANIASLRTKIAQNNSINADKEPVFTSVDSVLEDATDFVSTSSPETEVGGRNENYCLTQATVSQMWPSTGTIVEVVDGWRIYQTEIQREVVSGSSTTIVAENKVLLQTPVSPFRGIASNCLDATAVAVALDGSLIKNSDTWRFRTLPPTSLIGYARDGFPIYSSGVDESLLDSCGGYDNGVAYQYHLRSSELFVLGCFAAEPRPFL